MKCCCCWRFLYVINYSWIMINLLTKEWDFEIDIRRKYIIQLWVRDWPLGKWRVGGDGRGGEQKKIHAREGDLKNNRVENWRSEVEKFLKGELHFRVTKCTKWQLGRLFHTAVFKNFFGPGGIPNHLVFFTIRKTSIVPFKADTARSVVKYPCRKTLMDYHGL